jgi:hypothetical protein
LALGTNAPFPPPPPLPLPLPPSIASASLHPPPPNDTHPSSSPPHRTHPPSTPLPTTPPPAIFPSPPSPLSFSVTISYLEIHNESVRDLLAGDQGGNKLELRETSQGVLVPGLTMVRELSSPPPPHNVRRGGGAPVGESIEGEGGNLLGF